MLGPAMISELSAGPFLVLDAHLSNNVTTCCDDVKHKISDWLVNALVVVSRARCLGRDASQVTSLEKGAFCFFMITIC